MADSKEPDIVRLARLVREMRQAQARYFGGDRSRQAIGAAKDLEKRVDKAVGWVLDQHQAELFPAGPRGMAPIVAGLRGVGDEAAARLRRRRVPVSRL